MKSKEMMDIIINSTGIVFSGICKGKFVLGRIGSIARPILIGGHYYKKFTKDKPAKTIPVEELDVGRVYKTPTKHIIYIGRVSIINANNKNSIGWGVIPCYHENIPILCNETPIVTNRQINYIIKKTNYFHSKDSIQKSLFVNHKVLITFLEK